MSNLRIEILTPAREDINSIANYYATEFGATSAKKITEQIRKSIERLLVFPDSGSLTPDPVLNKMGYRMVVSGGFTSIYRVNENVIYIYHVASTRTNYPKLNMDKE